MPRGTATMHTVNFSHGNGYTCPHCGEENVLLHPDKFVTNLNGTDENMDFCWSCEKTVYVTRNKS